MGHIFVVGLGPGDISCMTAEARNAIEMSDTVIGYRVYIDLVKDLCAGKQLIESKMREEKERCEKCIELAGQGHTVALICSGDAGVYGMASPMLEIAAKEGFEDITVIPGITAALSGAALLGAPIGHDFCVISLSDLLTPWEIIENRLRHAAEGDFCIVLYNPSSHRRTDHLKKACKVMSTKITGDRPCGYVKNIGREGTETVICTFDELKDRQVDMFTTVFVGNSLTKREGDRLITPRGYVIG